MGRATVIGCFLIMAVGCSAPINPPDGKRADPSASAQPAARPTEFDRLLERYLQTIDAQVAARTAADDAEFRDSAKAHARARKTLEEKQEQILIRWRAEAKRPPEYRLDTEGGYEGCVYTYALGDSPISAALVAQVRDEGLIKDMRSVLPMVKGGAGLCRQWVTIIEETAAAYRDDEAFQIRVACLLYSCGVAEDRYRPILRKAVGDGNDWALRALLTTTDRRTGRALPRVDDKNVRLARDLAAHPRDVEQIPVVAWYLARIGENDLAGRACLSLWGEHEYPRVLKAMQGQNPPTDNDPADYQLARARANALPIMLREIRGERMLRAVYDLNQAYQTSAPSPFGPPVARRDGFYHTDALCRMEIAEVSSYLSEIAGDDSRSTPSE